MTQKWAFFTIGIMAGMIAILSFSLLLQASQPMAIASPASGTADPSAGIVLATGGSQQNLNDICWVVYKRKNTSQSGSDSGATQDDITNKEYLVSLGCYQVTKNLCYTIRATWVKWSQFILRGINHFTKHF